MPVAVFHEELPSRPVRNVKCVSFENGLKPLGPHNSNSKTMQQNSSSSNINKMVNSEDVMSDATTEKENFTSQLRLSIKKPSTNERRTRETSNSEKAENISNSLSSFRRSLLSTMKSPKAATTAILAPIARRHGLNPSGMKSPQKFRTVVMPKTPSSMLSNELEMADPDMSFLISPSAMANPNSFSHSPVFPSPPKQAQNVIPMTVEKETQLLKPAHKTAIGCKPASTRKVKSALLKRRIESKKQQEKIGKAKLPHVQEEQEPTGRTPFLVRGNGVQMDLSMMFSDFQSPERSNDKMQMIEKPGSRFQHQVPPVISLENMQKGLILDFGEEKLNEVGKSRYLPFSLEAPGNLASDAVVEIDRVPFQQGFDLVTHDPDNPDEFGSHSHVTNHLTSITNTPTIIIVQPGETKTLWVRWSPIEVGGVREFIVLRLPQGRGRLRITVIGCALSASKLLQETNQTKATISAMKSRLKQRSILETPATSAKKVGTRDGFRATPLRISTPSSASQTSSIVTGLSTKSHKLDNDWADKQCVAFAQWLNYMFQPSEDRDHETSLQILEEAGLNARAMGRAAFRTLILHRRIEQARTKSVAIYCGKDMQTIHGVIVSEIGRGRLALRPDQDLSADLTLRDQITSLLFSYSTAWLRLGLETIFGEPINADFPNHFSPQKVFSIKGKSEMTPKIGMSRMKRSLKKFIEARLLSDPKLLIKYTKGLCKKLSGNFEKKYLLEQRTLTLTRLLDLIFFLDKAKMENVLFHVPCLFARDTKVKSSRDVMIALCRDFLAQEGDVIKHLARIGLKVFYKQEAVDEIEYAIDNLAVDIRDGVRLARMTEILSNRPPKSLLVALRLPAVSRLQKLHNVGVVLESLEKCGVHGALQIAPHHIVDGHREMVLKLMWSVVSNCGLRALIDPDMIQDEIYSVLQSNKTRRTTWPLGEHKKIATSVNATRQGVDEGETSDTQVFRPLLIRWCDAICSYFGIKVTDLSTSFADGIVPCLLIHFYHPALLPLSEILPTTRHLHKRCELQSYDTAIVNERRNTALALITLTELGGIPKMLPVGDSKNPPDEKAMLLFVTYLCSRLMESSKEILACILIQDFYRRAKRIQLLKKKMASASYIWRTWSIQKGNYFENQHSLFAVPVEIIEKFVISRKHKLKAIRHLRLANVKRQVAATKLQSAARRWLVQRRILPVLYRSSRARIIQSCWRMFTAKHQVAKWVAERWAVNTIQRFLRGCMARDRFVESYLGVLTIQALMRGHTARKSLAKSRKAAVQIQRVWRGFSAALQYQVSLLDIVAIQSLARKKLAMGLRIKHLKAISIIQLACRRFAARRELNNRRLNYMEKVQMVLASLQIQSVVRMALARKKFKKTLFQESAANLIQSRWRSVCVRRSYQTKRTKCISLQSISRAFLARSRLKTQCSSAIVVQTKWRFYQTYMSYRRTIRIIIRIQAIVRRFLIARHLKSQKFAIHVIQCYSRRHIAIKQVRGLLIGRLKSTSAATIQKKWRSYKARSDFTLLQRSALLIQSLYRGDFVRREMQALVFFATLIQKQWRCYCVMVQYQVSLVDIIIVQSVFRRRTAALEVVRKVIALRCIQSAARFFLTSRRTVEKQRYFDACVAIQSFWKAVKASSSYGQTRSAVIRLQPVVRRYLVRCKEKRRLEAIVRIQANWRRFCAVADFHLVLGNIIRIQCTLRRYLVQAAYIRSRDSCVVLQCFVRSCIAHAIVTRMRKCLEAQATILFLKRNTCASTVQAYWRHYCMRKDMMNRADAATKIQTCWRSFVALIQFRIDLIDIIVVQSFVRRWLVHEHERRFDRATIVLQKNVRRFAASLLVSSLRLKKEYVHVEERSAVQIQRIFRGAAARSIFRRHKAAQMVQKTWRCYTIHVDFMLAMISAIMIQSALRGWRSLHEYQILRHGVRRLQALARGAVQRRKNSVTFKGVIALQSLARGVIVRDEIRYLCGKASILQKLARGFLARVEMELRNFAAGEIQRLWRGYSANADYLVTVISAIRIQCIFRQSAARSVLRDLLREKLLFNVELLFNEKQVLKIQKAFRAYLRRLNMASFVKTVQRAVRFYLARKEIRKVMNAIILIQSISRAYIIRRAISTKAKHVVARVSEATLRARQDPSMRLGERTRTALCVLQTSKRLSEIMFAVTTLEMSTRLSRNCCIAFTNAGAPEILYSLIRTCNRSLPHIELLNFILHTLRNVAAHRDLVDKVATTSAADIYLDLIQMFRDKDTIFSLAICLLDMATLTRIELKEKCSTKENLKRLRGVHSLCVRKMMGQARGPESAPLRSVSVSKRVSSYLRDREMMDRKLSVKLLHGIISRIEAD